jgi:hypothetical protein
MVLAGSEHWAGLSQVHVLLDGHRIKTLPSRLDARDPARLTASGAQPAGPPPLPPAAGDVTEVDRTVNASGNVRLGDHAISAGLPLAALPAATSDGTKPPTAPRPAAAPADLCPAGTFSAMLANVDDLDLLRHEFNAEDDSFLVQLRVD